MRIHNVTFPVFITQTYIDQGNSGTLDRPNNSSVELRNFTFANITGDINSDNPGDGSCRTDVSRITDSITREKQMKYSTDLATHTALLVQSRSQPDANRKPHPAMQHRDLMHRFRDVRHQHLSSEAGSAVCDLLQHRGRIEP